MKQVGSTKLDNIIVEEVSNIVNLGKKIKWDNDSMEDIKRRVQLATCRSVQRLQDSMEKEQHKTGNKGAVTSNTSVLHAAVCSGNVDNN